MKLDRAIMPWAKGQPEIVKATTRFQNSIPKALFPISDFLFDNAITFDTPNGMFNADPQGSKPLVDVFIYRREGFPTGLFLRLKDGHPLQGKALKARILG